MKSIYNELIRFVKQSSEWKNFEHKSYSDLDFDGLKKCAKFSSGNIGKNRTYATWMAFLGDGQTVQQGIYPVYLYYYKIGTLILAYGVSSSNTPTIVWPLEKKITIKEFFLQKGYKDNKNIWPYLKRYLGSYVYKVYTDPSNLEKMQVDEDLNKLIDEYKSVLQNSNLDLNNKSENQKDASYPQLFQAFKESLSNSGFLFSDSIVSRFILSLETKPFVILSGLSGSGKTQLALAFAKWITSDDSQYRLIPVGADWTNREYLLGYPNALERGRYVKPDNGALDLLLKATADKDHPYFMILDEMNLSYVERYFSDFLSAMESHEDIPLWEGSNDKGVENVVPAKVKFPKNLFIIGTINVDETTYMFSPKVLDRASVIEFRIGAEDMRSYLDGSIQTDSSKVGSKGINYAVKFLSTAKQSVDTEQKTDNLKKELIKFFKVLQKVNAEFGYRSAGEIYRFFSLAKSNTKESDNNILDAAIIQKLLPKLHGSRKKVEPVLKSLWALCRKENYAENLDTLNEMPDAGNFLYPLSAEKIYRMFKSAVDNGFTSFAEA